MDREEFIGSRRAAALLGVAPMTLRRRIRRGEVPVFEDPLDARRRLIRMADLEPLRTIRPAQPTDAAKVSVA